MEDGWPTRWIENIEQTGKSYNPPILPMRLEKRAYTSKCFGKLILFSPSVRFVQTMYSPSLNSLADLDDLALSQSMHPTVED